MPGQDRISTSNDELFDRPSTSHAMLDIDQKLPTPQEGESLLDSSISHKPLSPTETCVKPCCAVEHSDEKFHPSVCNGSKPNNVENSTSESSSSGCSKVKGAIETV